MGSFWSRWSKSPEDQFTDEMIGRVKALLGANAKRAEGFALSFDGPDGTVRTLSLDAIFVETRGLRGAARDVRLRTAVLAGGQELPPELWADALPRLLPAVRSAAWLSSGAIDGAVHRPLAPFISEVTAIDGEHGMAFVRGRNLEDWHVTADDVMNAASANLAKKPLNITKQGPMAFVTGPDGYISSWLAIPHRLAAIAKDVGHEVIATIPTRDQLILVDTSDSVAATTALQHALGEYAQSFRRISPVPYLVSESGIVPWEPPRNHPAAAHVYGAKRALADLEYGQQTRTLDAAFRATGEDVFVGSYELVRRADGSTWSWAVWVKQITNGLIPQVDLLVMGDDDDKPSRFAVRWADVMRLAPDALVREPSLDPARWRYRGWPVPDAVGSLRAAAVPFPPGPEVTEPA